MLRNHHVAIIVKYYFKATAPIGEFLGTDFAKAWPEEYQEAFKAGVWYEENPGPWLG
jgi:hypothetical protein